MGHSSFLRARPLADASFTVSGILPVCTPKGPSLGGTRNLKHLDRSIQGLDHPITRSSDHRMRYPPCPLPLFIPLHPKVIPPLSRLDPTPIPRFSPLTRTPIPLALTHATLLKLDVGDDARCGDHGDDRGNPVFHWVTRAPRNQAEGQKIQFGYSGNFGNSGNCLRGWMLTADC